MTTDAEPVCPDQARLRAHLDGADPQVAAHASGCDDCTAQLAGMRVDARWTAGAIAALGVDTPQVDVDAAWAARASATPSQASRPAAVVPLRRRRVTAGPASAVAASLLALLVAVLVVVTPGGRRAAADFLAQFRSERLTVVTVDPNDPMAELEGLAEIADVEADRSEPVTVDDLDQAAAIVGFTPSHVDTLPDGAQVEQTVASAPSTVRVTLRADRAPDLPADLDGAALVAQIPGSVGTQYTLGADVLVVAEAGQLVVDAEGADLADIRTYVLSRPEVPPSLARQLLAIDDWTATLPVPLPVDSVAWREVSVAGQPGLAIEDPMGAGLLWHDGDRIHAVGGTGLGLDELRAVADSVGG